LSYRTDEPTVIEYQMYKAVKSCCGDCMGYYSMWADLLERRSTEGRTRSYFLDLPISAMRREIATCTAIFEDLKVIAECLDQLNSQWHRDWHNPLHRRSEELTRRLEALRELSGDE
jgi:hypothetical protein